VPAPGAGSRRRLLIPLVVLGLLAAVLGVVLLGGGSEPEPAPPAVSSLTSGPLTVRLPAGWARVERVPATPGFALRGAVAAAPASGDGAIVLGLGSSSQPSLLPAGVRAGERAVAQLGDLRAYRYDGVGARRLTVFVAPTGAGVATVACIAPRPDCLRAAATLRIRGTRVFPLGPSRAYARVLNRSLIGLRAALRSGRAALRRADTPKAQATAAASIAAAHRRAAAVLAATELGPADRGLNTQLLDALRSGQRAYGALATAARAGRRAAYARAARQIADAERRLAAVQRAIASAGYGSLASARVTPATVPAMARERTATPVAPEPQATPAPQATAQPQPQPTTTAAPQPTPAPPKPKPLPDHGEDG
jgi:hypothetical protein